jgi:hypothetical protein
MLLPIKDCGKGVNKDTPASELAPGVWSDALNIEFDGITFRRRNGMQAVFTTPTAIPYFLLPYSVSNTTRHLIQAGIATIFTDDGTTRTDVTHATPPAGSIDDRWTGGVLHGVPFLNNGVNAPMYWDGNVANNFVTLAAWPAGDKVSVLRAFSFYLVGLGYTPSGVALQPYRVRWSNAAEPGSLPTTYTAADTNDAGEQDLTEAGTLVDCLPLGDANIIYGKEGRYAQRWIEGNSVFDFSPLPGKDGLLARGCVVDTPKGHVFLSNGDVMLHNGGEAVSIAEDKMRSWIFSTMDRTNAQRSFLTVNPQRSEVWVCFPSAGATTCDTAAVWNWTANTWSIYSLPNVTYGVAGLVPSLSTETIDSDTATIDSDVTTNDQDEFSSNERRLILSTSTPKIGLANTGSTDFGTAISQRLERTGIKPSDADQMLILNRSRWHLSGVDGTTLTVYHGSHRLAAAEPTYSSGVTLTQGTTEWVNAFAKSGKYLAIKATGTGSQPLVGRSIDLEYEVGGRF